jgi:hypothetical protein
MADLDSIIKNGEFTYDMANKLKYDQTNLPNYRGVPVQVYKTEKYTIYRPLKKIDRTPEMYTFVEIETFFFRRGRDDNTCYFGANNFDDFTDEQLPVKVIKNLIA